MSVTQPYMVLVCGSRDWTDLIAIAAELSVVASIHEPIVIIEGCAAGADRLAEQFAKASGWGLKHYPAEWVKYGKAAGPVRNRQMLIDGKPDLVLAFQKNKSKGTQHMIDISRAAGVPVKVVTG